MTAGAAGQDMETGVDTDLGIVRAGMVVLIVRDLAIGMDTAVIGTTVMAIVAAMTGGGIRSQLSALAQSLVVQLRLRRPHRSIARLLTVTATRMSSGVIIVIGPIGLPTTLSSRITVPVSSVIRHTDSGNLLNSMKPPFMGGFVFVD